MLEDWCIKYPLSDPLVSLALICRLAGHQRNREKKSLRQGQRGHSPPTTAKFLAVCKVYRTHTQTHTHMTAVQLLTMSAVPQ